ncbi:MAG: DJ-1/PfpI family protein [Candidatus Margulisbacteria bacterium]|nr:DJ-1/PfpI family protein [Candidatus Margulisiibacteriota bacterium]
MSTNKRILIVIAFQGFRDEEYAEPKQILEQAGFQVTTASSQSGTATGKLGMKTKVDITLDQVKVADYDAVIFIGGPGSYDYFNNAAALQIAKDSVKLGKVTAGICAAAAILAEAGVLKGKKAASFAGVANILKEKGANYSPSGYEVDGKIITADGPAHAKKFGQGIVEARS